MHPTKYFHRGILLAILIVVSFLWSETGTTAFADTPTVNGTINAGSLGLTAPGPYPFTGYPGLTSTFTIPFSVSDTTGGAAGWNLTISATQFTCCSAAHSLPITASTVTGTTGVCTAGGAVGVNCMQLTLTNTVGTSVAIPMTSSPPPVKFFGIAAASASGVYTITPTITVVVPAVTFLAIYASTFTLTIVAGP